LQTKMELAIKEKEIEVRESLDDRNKSNKSRYNNELQKAHEMINQREVELDQLERQNFQMKEDKKHLLNQIAKLEEQVEEVQKEAAHQLASLQQESEIKMVGLKEELDDAHLAYNQLKQENMRLDGNLVCKTQVEEELDQVKAEW